MLSSLRRCFLSAVFAGLVILIGVQPSDGAVRSARLFPVKDNASLFSSDAVGKVQNKIGDIQQKYNKEVLIETINKITGSPIKFAEDQMSKVSVNGVYVLISKSPAKVIALSSGESQKAFSKTALGNLQEVFVENLKNKEFDKALIEGIDSITTTYEKNFKVVPQEKETASKPKAPISAEPTGGFDGIWGWLCIGVVILLAVWFIIGLFRALSGGGRPIDRAPSTYAGQQAPPYAPSGPPSGYIPPPGHSAPQSSGGGFFPSLLGGLFGAAAGMYIYDSVFRGGSTPSSGPSMTPPAYGGGTSSPLPQDNFPVTSGGGADWGGDTSRAPEPDDGGADWNAGDDDGGADWNAGDDAGGADWNAGGDDSGGADWGGSDDDGGDGNDW